MADRIINMRQQLFDALRARGWSLQRIFCNSFGLSFLYGSLLLFCTCMQDVLVFLLILSNLSLSSSARIFQGFYIHETFI